MDSTLTFPELTVLGGSGFVGSYFLMNNSDKVASTNRRDDYNAHSKDILYFISTVHNYNIFTNTHCDINTNLNLLITVLDNWKKYLEKNNIDKSTACFNFISSWFVYGDCNGEKYPKGVPETATCNPKGFYSITKRCAEQLLISYCETFGMNYRILRLGSVVGAGDKKASAQKNALQYMINRLAKNEDIEIYDDGMFYRDYIHVIDCANAISLVLLRGNMNEIYNIGNGNSWYFKDILIWAKEKLNSQSKISFIPAKDFHTTVQVKSFFMNNSKLNALGYKPSLMPREMFEDMLPGRLYAGLVTYQTKT